MRKLGTTGVSLLLVCLLVFLVGPCTDAGPDVDPQDRVASQRAYVRLLEATPDSVLTGGSPLDTLFMDHDLSAFEPLSVDSLEAARWVDSVLATLTIDQKIGQLFIVHLPEPGLMQLIEDEALRAVEEYGVGGFLVPRLMEPRHVFRETQRLQRASAVPLFFAADYERGAGRFSNALTELPSNMALGATRDTLLAAAAGRLTALESRAVGVNLLLAPVVDVNNNPDNPIINIRSYGEDPHLVGQMAAAFVREAERYGVLTTLKHFPGHGNTSVDSHARMGAIRGDVAALDSTELRPYRLVLDHANPAGVMSAHLWVTALDTAPVPATFSRNVLEGLLRDTLGFEGLVLTDDICMGALRNRYDLHERLLRPLLAGADVILTPANLKRAFRVVKQSVRDGRLDEARIDASVRRILWAKARAGLHHNRFVDEGALEYLLEKPRGAYLAQAIADRAVTLVKTDPVLPLRPHHRVVLIQLSNTNNSESIEAAMETLADRLGPEREVRILEEPSRREAASMLDAAEDADVIVVALYLRLEAGRGEAGLLERQEILVRRLVDRDQPIVLMTFGNPYAISTFSDADALLVAYEQALESVQAAVRVLRGEQPAQGKLPVTIGSFAFGSGLTSVRDYASGPAEESPVRAN